MVYYQLHIYGGGCWAQALLVIISRNDNETCDELAAQKSEEGLHDSSDYSNCNENKGSLTIS